MQKKHTKTAGANSNLLKRVDQRDDVVALEADVTLKAGVTIWVGAHECGMRNATHFVGEQHAQRDADAGDLQLHLLLLSSSSSPSSSPCVYACKKTMFACIRARFKKRTHTCMVSERRKATHTCVYAFACNSLI